MALITTPGAANANSWASADDFDNFRLTRYPQVASVVALADDDAIEAALIVAARAMDADLDWTGSATDGVQAMTWPRLGMQTRNKFAIASNVIPQQLKDAQCEWAYQILAGTDFTADNDAAKQDISLVRAGDVEVRFQRADTSTSESVDLIIRRLGSEFNYLVVPGEVRRLLVSSWYNEPSIIRPLEFNVFGGSNGTR